MNVQIQVTFRKYLRPSRQLAERYESIIMLQQSWGVSASRIAEYIMTLEEDCGIYEPRTYTGPMVRTAINIIRKKRAENGRPRSKKNLSA